jgi:hypothetical protein
MPGRRRYSQRYRFDVPEPSNQSVPPIDAYYTLNVLLGFSQVPELARKEHDDIKAIYDGCCRDGCALGWKTYAYGMALWAGAKLGLAAPGSLIDRVAVILANPRAMRVLTAQDVGMLASGATAMAVVEGRQWRATADALTRHLDLHYRHSPSALFYNQALGFRRPFSSFASQVYSMLALYQYGEAFGADWAIELANNTAAKMIALQGRRGEWAWFYYVPGGRIVDFYEIYAVHQHGMAPAFLHHAVTHGVPGARDALIKGFGWLFRNNEMNISMLRPAERMFYRSQARDGELESRWPRGRRSVVNTLLRRSDSVEQHRGLVLRRECRSYELGWILWSFGARTDYQELTLHPEFSV